MHMPHVRVCVDACGCVHPSMNEKTVLFPSASSHVAAPSQLSVVPLFTFLVPIQVYSTVTIASKECCILLVAELRRTHCTSVFLGRWGNKLGRSVLLAHFTWYTGCEP